MKNKQIELKLVTELKDKEKELKHVFDTYVNYNKIFIWIRIAIFAVVAVIGVYNIFFAGKRYSISEYNTIKYTMAAALGIIACVLIGVAIVAFRKQYEIRALVKTLASSKKMNYKDLKKEINIVLKSSFGGPGI